MKRIIPAILLLLSLTGCYNSGEPRERVLKIYNWADYIGDGVLEDFQAYYKEQTGENIRIVYQTFDINEIMLTKIEKGHEDFDVVCPSEYIIERMLKKRLLLPIDTNFAHSPNYMKNVMRYAICGELRDFFITGLMFPIRLQHPGIVFGIRGMPAKSL